jgi:hypothetical protein
MNKRQLLGIVGVVLAISLSGSVIAQESRGPVVRIAELQIDPAQLENYKAGRSRSLCRSRERQANDAQVLRNVRR